MRPTALLALAVSLLSAEARAATCWVAYVHGKLTSAPGFGPSNLSPDAGASDADRRNYWRHGPSDTWGDFVLYSGIYRGCAVLVTGYDGTAGFWDYGASGQVAKQLNQWIAAQGVP